ncbi:hypothetical protein OC842_006356 [Tilletia horrida]|uniref:NADP-dependent oxidoreductase domain-containing protein n=1 Tax=Tilletia horrida TaxID=155126 RepID=A0AAN6JHN4_9BASI|nr:hypothetical protein OC842_006356 [Tilletia horrida]
MSIPQREFGNTGLTLPAIGYGAMGLAAIYGPHKTQEVADACFAELLKQGVQMVDTSDSYTDFSMGKLGTGEEQIASFLKRNPGARERFFIATKFGFTLDFSVRGDRDYVLQACQASLDRLGIDQIDLYYHHRPSPTDVAETAAALKELKESGKIKYIGVSEYTLEQLKRANEVVHIDAYQIEFSPFTPEILENGLADWCEKNGTAIVAYSPLGRGMLARSVSKPEDLHDHDFRKSTERWTAENFKKNLELVDTLEQFGKKKGYTSGQIALAWVLSKGKTIIPIPGSTRPERIAENVASAKIQLTGEELEKINQIIASFKTSGARYSGGLGPAF